MFWQSHEKKLYAAIEKGKEIKVKKYMAKCDNNIANEDGWTPLHAASYYGHADIARFLLQTYNIDQKDYTGRTALYLASEAGHVDVVKVLVTESIKADIATNGGMGPLHTACWNGHLPVVKILMEHCNANMKACLGSTPLDMAASQGKIEVVRYLVSKKVDVQAVNSNGWNALHSASWWGQAEVVRFLMQYCDINQKTNAGNTALDLALERRRKEVVMILQEKEESHFTLFDSVRLGRIDLVRKVAKTSAIHSLDESGWSALHVACANNQDEVVEFLLGHIDVNLQTKEGATPLYVAAGNGHLKIVIQLIGHKANVALSHHSGWSPLHIASSKGHVDTVAHLADCIDINLPTNHGSTPLHLAATYGKLEVVKCLIAKKANTHAVDTNGSSPLHDACANGHIDVVGYLIDYVDVNFRNNNGQTPLYQAAHSGKLEIVKFLLDKAQVGAVSNNGWTPLHDACANGHLEIVKVLVNYIDINARTKDGATPLYVAAGNGKLAIVNFLIEAQASVALPSNIGWTPLHSACYNGQLEVVKVLSKLIDLNSLTKAGTTPLYVAAGSGRLEVVTFLLSQNVRFSDQNGSTPLHRAASNGHLDVVKLLLDHVQDVNLRTQDGQTALHKAAQHGRLNIVKYLMTREINYEIVSHSGWSPLHSAVWSGHLDVVRMLVEYIDVDIQTDGGATPLYVAAGTGNAAIANFLLAKNANVTLPTNIGWSPLHVACSLGHFDVAMSVAEYVNPRLTTSIRWNASKTAFLDGSPELRQAMADKIQAMLAMKRNVVQRYHKPTKELDDPDEWERESELTTEGTMYSYDEQKDGYF
ncbi:hypothetical protein LEN26_000236 [Aphanomyces euteiches]|nr:hypothetical protein AeMF1_019069 [Aphanomyces euteiches]KAH9164013.1 hypothetical protein LEN26_000236 [Aphanomyces euteiches]KAH9196993.1 hypothetical protein AeNC1_001024 [Aphanomyces euteiches]